MSPDYGKSHGLLPTAVSGSPTVLVDADLRRPHLHTILGVSNEAGLTTMVADMARIKDLYIPKFTFLFAGREFGAYSN